jgi:putative DNA primase/helicase
MEPQAKPMSNASAQGITMSTPQSAPIALLVPASNLKCRPTTWLWPGRIPGAKLTLLAGAPGSGKTALALSIIAAVTTGGGYPCHEGSAPKGSGILVSPHGDPDVLVPRLKAAGADLSRVHLLSEVPGAKGPRPFDLATDLPLLDAAVQSIKDLRVIVIDALNPATGREAARATGALLEALARLAQAHDVSIITILQPAGIDRGAANPVSFDGAALAAARAAFAIVSDPGDEKRRLLIQVKNDLAPEAGTLAFRVTAQQIQPGQSAARIAFEPQYHSLSAREFTARQARGFNSAKADAIEFLRSLLGSAAHCKVTHIEHEARAAGLLRASQALTQCRVLRDARMAMGLALTRDGADGGAWVWAKPGTQQQQAPAKQEQSLAA